MADVTWAIAGLLLMLPAEMKPLHMAAQRVPSDTRAVDELFCSWQSPHGQKLTVLWWNTPHPPRSGGPMRVAEQWDGTFAGRAVTISRTSLFMGTERDVLRASTSIPEQDSSILVYAEGFARDTFEHILRTGRLAPGNKAMRLACEQRP
jgi:hypothetical protein